MLKLFGGAWILRVGVASEGGGRQQSHRPALAHNPWGGARVASPQEPEKGPSLIVARSLLAVTVDLSPLANISDDTITAAC